MNPVEASELPGPDALDRALGIAFRHDELRETALTHRSFAFEHGIARTNERLEFLGDSVLGLVVTDMAFEAFPDMPEGELAKLRAAIVNAQALAEVARSLGLGELVLLGKGEEQSGGRNKASILADALEAVFGAVYLDRGIAEAGRVILGLFLPRIRGQVEGGTVQDYKTSLQELAAARLGTLPEYRIAESGPDHAKRFQATVFLAGEEHGSGEGRSKKEAEQAAAREAVARLRSAPGSAPARTSSRPRAGS